MDFGFVFSGQAGFDGLWDEFVVENSNVSWRYLPCWREYQMLYSGEAFVKELSFIVTRNTEPVALCPLFLERFDEHLMLAHGAVGGGQAGYQAGPLLKNAINCKHRKKVERTCFATIDDLAVEHNAAKAMLFVDPFPEQVNHNPLTEYGYLNASISTMIVDLSLDKKELWQNLRKSYKSLINNGRKKFEIIIIDTFSADYGVHDLYKKLHHKTAGRVTRDQRTFDLQFEMLKDDKAVLIGLADKKCFVAFSYFFHHNGCAYYGSSCDDPDYKTEVPIEHCIIWSAIEYYKRRGFRHLEIGWQQFGSQLFDHPAEKDLSIAFFKRGFGSRVISYHRGIKYYDKDYMEYDLHKNVQRLLDDQKVIESI